MKTQMNTFFKLIVLTFFITACENEATDNTYTSEINSDYIVASEVANTIALNLLSTDSKSTNTIQTKIKTVKDKNRNPYFHIITTEEAFVIVSGDKRTTPVIGYGQEVFELTEIPDQLQYWLSQFTEQIDHYRINQIEDNDKLGTFKKRALQENIYSSKIRKSKSDKEFGAPLISTNWNQGCVYNALSPKKGSIPSLQCNNNLPCDRAYTGCVSTCLSQMINFYRSMDTIDYTLLKKTYDPYNDIDTPEGIEVARLMRNVGDIMQMDYQCSGSGSPADYLLQELQISELLGFTSPIQTRYYSRYARYTIMSEIQSGNPVVFSGIDRNSNAGHFWIADGVHITEDYDIYIHFNWGWGGNRNGWFALGDFNAGNYNFARSTQAIYNFRNDAIEIFRDSKK